MSSSDGRIIRIFSRRASSPPSTANFATAAAPCHVPLPRVPRACDLCDQFPNLRALHVFWYLLQIDSHRVRHHRLRSSNSPCRDSDLVVSRLPKYEAVVDHYGNPRLATGNRRACHRIVVPALSAPLDPSLCGRNLHLVRKITVNRCIDRDGTFPWPTAEDQVELDQVP